MYCIVLYCCNDLSAIFLVNGSWFGLVFQTKPRTKTLKKNNWFGKMTRDGKSKKKYKRKHFAEKKLLVLLLVNDKGCPK